MQENVVPELLFLDEQYEPDVFIQHQSDLESLPSELVSLSSFTEDEDDSFFCAFPLPDSLDAKTDTLDVQPDAVDSMVAKEMSSLSMKDRDKVYSDVHGVSATVEETPDLVRHSLILMQEELNKLEDIPAYYMAKEMDPAYVQDENFRLMFLRADLFDAKKAAERLGLHFKSKLELFGKSMLTKTITQDHLDEETLKVLYGGRMATLEERDSAGRVAMVNFVQDTNVSVAAKLKAVYYGVMVSADDVETQRRGCVGISYTVGQNLGWLQLSPHRREWNLKVAQLTLALPIRYDAIHICHDSLAARVLLALFKLGGGQGSRLRTREHFGTREECLFSLQTFGIPVHCFPLDKNGNILTEHLAEKMEKRRKLERLCQKELESQGANAPARVVVPSRNDVLFGRGKAYYRHIGNLRLRAKVEEYAPEYDKLNTAGKQRIRDEILSGVHDSMGRFLRDDGAGWVEVPDAVAGQKVAHAFRTLRGVKLVASVTKDRKMVSREDSTRKEAQPLKRPR